MKRGRVLLAVGLLAAVAGLLWIVRANDPSAPDAAFPRCMFHVATGLHCPGCGSTRAVHALLHADVGAAFGWNALLVLLLPVLIPALLLELTAWLLPGRAVPRLRPGRFGGWILLGAVFAFWVLRNLPGPVGAALAPH